MARAKWMGRGGGGKCSVVCRVGSMCGLIGIGRTLLFTERNKVVTGF